MAYNYSFPDNIIDLTDSFILADHCAISNAIINLDTDESLCIDDSFETQKQSKDKGTTKSKGVEHKKSSKRKKLIRQNPKNEENKPSSKFGDCPICWDDLGENPLASTKCGHVFCIKCLEQSLKIEKRCPTCRTILRGSSAYHPLYLSYS